MRPEERLPTKRTASSGSRVPPAVTSTRLPASVPVASAEQLLDALEDLLRLGHPPHSELALGGLALVWPDQLDAALTQRRRVRLRRRVSPHAWVHRGRDEHGAAVGERSLGQDVVGKPVGELRHRVRGQRRDHEQVGAGQVRIEVLLRRPPSECGESLPPHEPVGAARDERDDVVPRTHEQARQLTGFVGGDAAGNAKKDPRHPYIVPTPPNVNSWAGRRRLHGSTVAKLRDPDHSVLKRVESGPVYRRKSRSSPLGPEEIFAVLR